MPKKLNIIVYCNEPHIIEPGVCALCERDALQQQVAQICKILTRHSAHCAASEQVGDLKRLLRIAIEQPAAIVFEDGRPTTIVRDRN